MNRLIFFTVLLLFVGCTDPIERILYDAEPMVKKVLRSPDKYEVQIFYVQIDRTADQSPRFKEYCYRLDKNKYFYPASTVKLPTALLALEKLYELKIAGLDRNARMRIDSARAPQTSALIDSTSEHGTPSVGHYIHQVLLVSDNAAHNRLYEFIGQEEILDRLRKHELKKTRILHRLSAPEFSFEDNRYANPVSFYHADTLIYRQPERHAPVFHPDPDIEGQLKGKGYIDNEGKLITEPFDFTNRNFYPLEEQVQVMKAIMFPSFVKADQQFCIHPDDYAFLHREMGLLPRESQFPSYDTTEFRDGYAKFFMFGDRKSSIPSHIRIFNKAGWAYGYMTDCAYIVDFQNKVEFILAATILVNDDEVFNDEKYEFETIGLPYLAGLGRAFYQHELDRKRKHEPELNELQKLFSERPNQ